MATTIHDHDFSYSVDKLINKADFAKHPRFTKFMDIAKGVSELSTFYKYRLGAIITIKGKVVARGWNKAKSHPKQKHYNELRSTVVDGAPHYVHAEMDAINKAISMGIDLSKAELTVYRTGLDKQQKMARPCAACMSAIKEVNIPIIHYSTADGLATEYLDINKPIRVKNATRLI